MIKRIIAALTAIVFLIVLAVGVSADNQYVTLSDYGWGTCFYESSKIKNLNFISDTTTIPSLSASLTNYIFCYWAFDINQSYTYTCNLQLRINYTSPVFVDNYIKRLSTIFYNNQALPTNTTDNVNCYTSDNMIYSVKVDNQDNKSAIINLSVSFNPDYCGITLNTIHLYSLFSISFSSSYTYTVIGWGTSCEYDPGGSKYIEEYLNQIVNAGSGYPVPDDSTLDSSVNSLNSAEGVVKDKSSSLINSVSSEMSDNLSQAKSLSTTLKPAAVQINNIYNSFLSVLPAEVKAVFIAVPLLLFVGWLVGRIKE